MDYNPFALDGKTILVTGASSGIGRRTAIDCSRMGARMYITGRSQERLAKTLDDLAPAEPGHVAVPADLTVDADVASLVDAVDPLDGLVLCAGQGIVKPLQFATTRIIAGHLAINLYAQVELTRLLFKKRKLSPGASVVIIDSIGGTVHFSVGNGVYGMGKAALLSYAKTAALEFACRRIRVNAVLPGMIDTPLIYCGSLTKEQLDAHAQDYPLKRYGQPQDVSNACLYLLSDAASWVTGQGLIVDGGISI